MENINLVKIEYTEEDIDTLIELGGDETIYESFPSILSWIVASAAAGEISYFICDGTKKIGFIGLSYFGFDRDHYFLDQAIIKSYQNKGIGSLTKNMFFKEIGSINKPILVRTGENNILGNKSIEKYATYMCTKNGENFYYLNNQEFCYEENKEFILKLKIYKNKKDAMKDQY